MSLKAIKGNKHKYDRIFVLNGRHPTYAYLETKICEHWPDGVDVQELLDWAREHTPFKLGEVRCPCDPGCRSQPHLALVCFVLCAAEDKYHDGVFGEFGKITMERLDRITGEHSWE